MRKIHSSLIAALSGAVMGITATLAQAGPESNSSTVGKEPKVTEEAKPSEPPVLAALPKSSERSVIRALIEQETLATNLPADIAEAMVFVESSYDASTIGRVGEIGLMQVRPGTAAMLGFKGSAAELAKPELNIHYGVTYLSQAWNLAQGDLCRALMKYRAGHGEEVMSPLSVTYCNRARSRLAAMRSPYAGPGTWPTVALAPTAPAEADLRSTLELVRPMDVYATYRRGTPEASRAFWAAHEARVHAIVARIEGKWRSVASH
jgi:hypothetical protein